MSRTRALSAERFVDAAQRSGHDGALARELLAPYVPRDVSDEVDAVVRGVAVRDALDPSVNAGALAVCLAAALRAATSADDVLRLEDAMQQVLASPQLGVQLRFFPALLAQWAHALSERGRLVSHQYATFWLTRLLEQTCAGYRGVSGVHAPLLFEYLRCGAYASALALARAVDSDATDFGAHVVRAVDLLEYQYYAGLAFAAAHEYDAAIDAWELCLAVPGDTPSWVQVDALKKAILVRLLRHGRIPDVDRMLAHASASARTQYTRECRDAYLAFARSYAESLPQDRAATDAIVEAVRPQFAQDANEGLVDRCLALRERRWIRGLADVYTTLPLTALAIYVHGHAHAAAVDAVQAELSAMSDIFTAAPDDAPAHVPLPGGRCAPRDADARFVRFRVLLAVDEAALQHALVAALARERDASERLVKRHESVATSHQLLAKVWSTHSGPPQDADGTWEEEDGGG
ncbi:hypothetical protein MSPP1_004178 [Malassezia sp. CBS 17886]|nr:hypothetical protein MSPP1_004178 [Malassezia sp. CBS 17886]